MDIKFEIALTVTGDPLLCNTPCPFSTEPINTRVNVGSKACARCQYFESIDPKNKIVKCKHQ